MSEARSMVFESIQAFFSRSARQHGQRVAIDEGGHRLTYAELEERSSRLAGTLAAAGAVPGTVVGLLADRRSNVIAGILGILKAGCAFVPLDASTPERRLRQIVEAAAPGWFFAEKGMLPLLAGVVPAGTRVICLDAAAGQSLDGGPLQVEPCRDGFDRGLLAGLLPGDPDPDALAYIYFTSGSTGTPKGIAGRLKGIDHFIRWEIELLGLQPGCRVSQLTTPAFDAFLRDAFVPLCAGGTVCVPESRETVLDARRLVDWLDLEEVEVIHCVPSLFRAICNQPLSAGYFAALRYVLMAGEPLLPADVARWTAVFGDRVQLVNLYGPSETTMTKLFYFVTPEDAQRKSIPIGKPMPGSRALVLGPDRKVCPQGTVGEIYLRTPYRTLGYYRQPEATAQAFVQNPFSQDPADIIYRTGDLGRILADGNFEFLGRKDSQVKVRGVRIELGEIESRLLGHPEVADVAVVDREDPDGGRSLCAYVVLERPVDSGALRDFLAAELPAAMVPSHFVSMAELPRTLTGKIDRKALPAPDPERADPAGFVAPRSLNEELLAGIWCELLGLPKVGIHNSFFDVGGHSLLATQLLSRIRATFDVELPLNRLFETPTIAGLAEGIADAARNGGLPKAPPLRRVPRTDRMPLSFAQQRLWFLDRLEPASAAYNIHTPLLLRGPVDVAAMTWSLDEIFRRHESLRTVFPVVDGEPVQRVRPQEPVPLPVVDLSGLPERILVAERSRLSREAAARPFRFTQDLMLRALLVRTGDTEHALLLTMHHIASDAWSSAILFREWTALYAAARAGRPSPLPELPIQYADYATWQREWIQGEVKEALVSYWRQELADSPPFLDLPTDRPRPALQTYRGALAGFRLDRWLREALERLSRAWNTTLFMTLAAAFQALMARYSGQADVVIGAPSAGRNRAELEPMIGFFINPMVLRLDLRGDPTFAEALGRARRMVLGALAHQDLPFQMLIEELRPVRDRSRAPIYQVAFGLQNVPAERSSTADLAVSPLGNEVTTSKLDLDLNMGDAEDGLGGSMEYNSDLFDDATARRLLQHFSRLLENIAEHPERRISDLDFLTAHEAQQLTVEWNDTRAPLDERGVHELISAHAARRPDALALAFQDRRVSYGELERRSNQVARYLADLGVGPGVVVGLCLERSPEMVIGLLGILKAGAAYLPLDPAYPAERLSFLLEDAQPPVLLSEERLAEALPAFWGFTVNLDTQEAAIAATGDGPLASAAAPEDAAYVIYTSGSTGWPKGVVVSHRGLRNLAEAQTRGFGVEPESRVLQFASLSFDASVSEIAMALWAGASLHLAEREELMSGRGFARRIRESGITHVTLPPSVLAALAPEELPPGLTLILAGEACPPELARLWSASHRVIDAYGPTEFTVCATFGVVTPEDGEPSIGRPIANTELHVLDRAGRPVPIGVPGELFVGGAGTARGYLNQPGLTAERFVPGGSGAWDGGRLYATGDRVRYRPDGRLEFLGRADAQVKLRGFRIELGEIEAALARHPGVREAVVLAREKSPGEPRLVSYVVAADTPVGAPAAAELRQFLQERLPEHMLPAAFVVLESWPRLPSGKVDRQALPEPEAQAVEPEGWATPRNPLEETLVGIWAEVLGRERVGIHEGFFELGGYSLAATQVLARIRDLFGVEISLGQFFAAPTVAGIAEEVEGALRGDAAAGVPPLRPADRGEDLPLSFAQEAMWRAERRDPYRYRTHVSFAFRIAGPLDTGALEGTLQEIVRRHEILRTAYPERGGAPVQEVHPPHPRPLGIVDLGGMPADRRLAAATEMARQESRRRFDLENGPPTRWLLFRLDADQHLLLLVCHHIATDQWSGGLFAREINALYGAFSRGEVSPLPELPLQYADFAVWQRRWLQGEALEGHLAYWRRQLAGARPLELPTDHPREARPVFGQAAEEFALLAPAVAEELHALSRREGVTLFMTLLAAFNAVLFDVTGEDDIVLSSPVANRRFREIEPLIGFFPNMLILRTRLAGDPTFLELLQRVRTVALDAYSHQDLPFEALIEEAERFSGLRRDLLRVSCNFYNAPAAPLRLSGLDLRMADLGLEPTRTDLLLLFQESPQGLKCGFFYREDLFAASRMARLRDRFHALIEGVLADPRQTLSALLAAARPAGELEAATTNR